jgi:MoCo/4Fe-4S cofactor protein with predicted Tat translocation signal
MSTSIHLPIVSETVGEAERETAAVTAEVRGQWRSIAERQGGAALARAAAREFPHGASELPEPSRRAFMQLLGSGAAVAGAAAGCVQPPSQAVPFVRRPAEVTPGVPLHFATGYPMDGFATGLVVESWEGRPTKIEGSSEHPDSLGAATAQHQALTQGLYDNDRAKQLKHRGQPIAWRSFLRQVDGLVHRHQQDQGAHLRFLTEPTASPLLVELRRRILERFPKARFVSYSPTAGDAVEGLRLAFGRALEARHDLSRATTIVCLDADILGEGPEQLRATRGFAARRVPGPDMNRLYVAEPSLTVTGMSADHRLRMRAGDVGALAQALVAELAGRPGFAQLAPLAGLGRTGQGAPKIDVKWVQAVARDLAQNRGRSLVIAGRRQPAAVHALAAALNVALDNVGLAVSYANPMDPDALAGSRALAPLVQEIAAAEVHTLVVTARNPVYASAADFKLDKLLPRVPEVIYHTLYEDETAAVSNTIVPAAHALESWGDARGTDGTVTFIQPLIAPLWGGVTDAEVLAAFLGEGDVGAHELLRRSWHAKTGAPLHAAAAAGAGLEAPAGAAIAAPTKAPGATAAAAPAAPAAPATVAAPLAGASGASPEMFDQLWERWLSDGVLAGSATQPEANLTLDGAALAGTLGPMLGAAARGGQGLEIAFAADYKVLDGRFGNATWLQELPDPVTKVTWDNGALMSPATAKALGVEVERDGDKLSTIAIDYRDRHLEAPALIVPGHADDCITLVLGYGRKGAETVARGIGYNAYSIRTSDAPWFDRGATVSLATDMHLFGVTQNHWSTEGRDPAMAVTLTDLRNEHSHFHERVEERRGPQLTIHQPVDYSKEQYKWGMAIDLSRCTGCSACVVACQSENNTPVVGKANVVVGREMQWIRIDRYFSGEIEEPTVVTQPLTCMHCETAPCEYVCPVNATVHSDEGLNEMVYNRCIGTRYCSNNCPYKVRRFNFLDYTSETPAVRRLGMNPDVTVRSRGIMEKCTYCVQRIERKRIETRIAGRAIADGELVTACAQGCPADAIVFGNLNDAKSRVAKLHADARRYDLLHELGTRPRTAYLARVRNLNPELPPPGGEAGSGHGGGGHQPKKGGHEG